MPRVLFICHGHPDIVPGGTEYVAHDLFRHLRDDDRAEGMFLGCVSPLHRPQRPGQVFQAAGRSGDEMLMWVGAFDRFMLAHPDVGPIAAGLRELLLSFQPDVVHFHHIQRVGLEALAIVRRTLPEARIVLTLHDYNAICFNDGLMTTSTTSAAASSGYPCLKPQPGSCHQCFPDIASGRFAVRELYVRGMLQCVDRFIAPSRFIRDRFVAWGLPRNAISLIANGIDDTLTPLGETGHRPRRTVGYFGNLAPHKGTLVLLAAIRQLVEQGVSIELHLHGGMNFQPAAFRQSVDEALAAAGAAVTVSGAYRRSELPKLLHEVDWVVVPSTWWENAPLVVLEAFRMRRPVICSAIGGLEELVTEGVTGLHARPGDSLDLARVMRRAVETPELWSNLVANLPSVPTIAEVSDQHIALYQSLFRNEEALSA